MHAAQEMGFTESVARLGDDDGKVLAALEAASLLEVDLEEVYTEIVQCWCFPLSGLDLKEKKVDRATLEDRRGSIAVG